MNYLISLANVHGLYSAYRDAINITKIMNENNVDQKNMFTIIAGARGLDTTKCIGNVFNINSKNELINTINNVKETINKDDNPKNILIVLSSHGYQCNVDSSRSESDGMTEYIVIDSDIVIDDEISELFLRGYKNDVTIFSLVDTCHSGTMMDLPFKIIDGKKIVENKNVFQHDIFCISSCADNQMSSDDISNMGFGGGLICAFIDELLENRTNIYDEVKFVELHDRIAKRLSCFGQNSIFSVSK